MLLGILNNVRSAILCESFPLAINSHVINRMLETHNIKHKVVHPAYQKPDHYSTSYTRCGIMTYTGNV